MRHPFDGIIIPDATLSQTESGSLPADETPTPGASRRTFIQGLGAMCAAVGGALALPQRGTAQEPQRWRQVHGSDEPRQQQDEARHADQPTTMAVGEEGGRGQEPNDRYTTYAVGEEGSRGDQHGRYTTYALGEEGSQGDHHGRYTTYALGEEGSSRYYDRWYPPRVYWDHWHWSGHIPWQGGYYHYTKRALREEGGW